MSTKIIVSGRVQGVSFRRFVEINAVKLDLSGYVKNLNNGDVEIVVDGNKKNIDKLITECEKGSPASVVKNIFIEKDDDYNFNGFNIRN
ncbi:MAG: acylphosphatase [Candidatus Pacearchaeota archaeon]|jgi:acylphosphatase